jgi:hypothetical protein
MAQKSDSRVFEDGDAMKQFMRRQNWRIVDWVADNWERCEGLTGPIHKSTVSKALSGTPVVEPVANAMDILFGEMFADPWAWCEPPELDDLSAYAPLTWWFKTLHPPMAWARFERMNKYPLEGDERELTQQRLTEWQDRLRAACDQFKADNALVRALESDEDPEFQCWVDEDGDKRLLTDREQVQYDAKNWQGVQVYRRRVGNPGLHGKTAEEIGLAWALADAVLTLPVIEDAKLAYTRPRAVPDPTHFSEPVDPWNGQEFEGVELGECTTKIRHEVNWKYKHRVRFYWDDQRYLVEDVEPFAFIWDDEWRAPSQAERDLLETGMQRKYETRDELMARRDEWIAEVWENQKETWEENDQFVRFNKKDFPDGVPKSAAARQFKVALDMISDEAAADELREISRLRMAFRRRLRRRAG